MDLIDRDLILVCISESQSNSQVIKEANEIAQNEKAKLIALYVSDRDKFQKKKDNDYLQDNLSLAENMGAMVEIIYDDDIASQIVNFAKLYKVKKIVIGKNRNDFKLLSLNTSIYDQVVKKSDRIDIYAVPINDKVKTYGFKENKNISKDLLIAFIILAISTLIGYIFYDFGYSDANIIMIYILGVFFIAFVTYDELVSFISSVICVLAFNYCFTKPTLSLSVSNPEYIITFLVLLIVSFLTSKLASQIRKNAKNSSNMTYITKLLLETNQLLQTKISKHEIIETGCNQLSNLLNRNIVYYDIVDGEIQDPLIFKDDFRDADKEFLKELEIVKWVFAKNKSAGAGTEYLPDAKYLYYAIRFNTSVYGVIGIHLGKDRLDSVENKILLAILGDMSLALEKEKILKDKNEANLRIKDEQLKTNLLRSISHDLRTPLTTIYGNSDILLNNSENLTETMKLGLYRDIYDDSQWLLNLIENLLSVTRVEEGKSKLKIEPQMVEEVIEEALKHVSRDKKNHNITVDIDDDYLMADMDVRLIIQVIINLVDNAIKYTFEGSSINIRAYQDANKVIIQVADNGKGIEDTDKKKIFQKFYSANNRIIDSKRSIGLGLYLCRIIVKAHGGEISVTDNIPSGSVFTMVLKASQ